MRLFCLFTEIVLSSGQPTNKTGMDRTAKNLIIGTSVAPHGLALSQCYHKSSGHGFQKI